MGEIYECVPETSVVDQSSAYSARTSLGAVNGAKCAQKTAVVVAPANKMSKGIYSGERVGAKSRLGQLAKKGEGA